jgi:ribosome-binding factor A
MSLKRIARVNEILKREIAETLYRVMNEQGFDLAAVTVTRVLASPDLRSARVMVSIRDHAGERDAMLAKVMRHRKTIQDAINRHVKIKYTPRLSFEIDPSIEAGDRVLGILHQLHLDDPEAAVPDAPDDESPQPTT